ncbi:hypothetical protein B0J17DRAFT_716972 [Rhizoctonia solani]|nr:hypothetical protein B0J17DRAFT_716972 [Rhizoctonia solani]
MSTPYDPRTPPTRLRTTEPLQFMVFGGTGVGKTSFVNDASGANLRIGHDLPSCTKAVQAGPIFSVESRAVQLVDTPGFDDTTLTDTEILQQIAEFLLDQHARKQQITGILYIHRITDNRMSGASIRALSLFEKICGSQAMRNAVIITNMWSTPRDPQEEARENQLMNEYFRNAIDNGAKVARRGGTGPRSALAILNLLLNCTPVTLQIQTEMAIYHRPLDETEAGALVDQNLRKRLERQEKERVELEEELESAREERDRRAEEQLERFKRDKEVEVQLLRQQLDLLRNASARQRQNFHPRAETEGQHLGGSTSPITVLRDVQPTYPLRFHLIVLLLITAGPFFRHIFGGVTQGGGVLLDFVGRGTPTHPAQALLTDFLLLLFQLVQLTIAYETARWKPEVPDPLFTPPVPVAPLETTTTPKPRSRRSERRSRQTHPRTTRAGYRDAIENRTRHVQTSTSSFPLTTAVIDLPLRTLMRLLLHSAPSDEGFDLPGPVTDGRRRVGLAAQLVVTLLRMRAVRQGGGAGGQAQPPS